MEDNGEEQEADEIVRRLKAPPRRSFTARWSPDDLSDVLTDDMARAISEEIDKEILAELMRTLGK